MATRQELADRLQAAQREIQRLNGLLKLERNNAMQSQQSLEQKSRELRTARSAMRQSADYIKLLEARLNGEAVSFAQTGPSMRTVPAGWLMGLREENRVLRRRLNESGAV